MDNTKPEREVEFWGPDDAERLIHTDMDSAIESMLDDLPGKPFPEKIIVYGYAKREVETFHPFVLDYCLERLDEEYGDHDGGDYTEATDAMKEAEKVFLEVIKKEYIPQTCEPVCQKEIIVMDWIKENRPD
jgi:hypothetical protein